MSDAQPTPRPEPQPDIDPRTRRRNRVMLVGIAAIFIVPILVATAINVLGLRPAPTRQHGELLDPRPDLRELSPTTLDGGRYGWDPAARRWRILLAPPAGCDAACQRLGADLDKVWQLFGKDADRVDVLWLCAAERCTVADGAQRIATLRTLRPDPALRARLPQVDDARGTPVYVVDPYGFVVLRYAPGTDPGGLRSDVARLIKLK
ncbi:hypothetical protein [Cognatilysobacter tabacisoli]|uniref:hypothetical protein n=1 Tax=Cognatilysobacter tabacisoli TaxID=2315424 RepID=UPI001E4E8890|nr:hypothetical protein [Lysobacter tabacisoli]